MANLLYLVHRLPYPPNKGDKVRSYHLLKHLAARHRVFLGTFVDDPEDEAHVDTLRALCAGLHVARLHPARARIGSLAGLLDGEALTLRYYRDAALQRWVRETVRRERIDAVGRVLVVDGAVRRRPAACRCWWTSSTSTRPSGPQYAAHHRWPMSWLYRREGEQLLAYERAVAARAARSFFVTEKETALFRSLAPESAGTCEALCNGVDADYFAPDPARASPFAAGELPVVFTGAMDYWPNIDAVTWFATRCCPRCATQWPALRFHIVGRSPAPAVRALAGEAVNVTGTVPDVRPYLQHAAVVVAPLRLARGIQNKILEAMAMGRPVVASRECAEAITAQRGSELVDAADAEALRARGRRAAARSRLRAAAIGAAGRRRVLHDYSWDAHLGAFERHLAPLRADQPLAA